MWRYCPKQKEGEDDATIEELLDRNIVYLTRYARISYEAVHQMELAEMHRNVNAALFWVRAENSKPTEDEMTPNELLER